MISKDTLTDEWVKQVIVNIGTHRKSPDKILVEKAIRALLLLEGLSQSGLEFIFKGGTAVMLIQNPPKRISIDIDIVSSKLTNPEDNFNSFLRNKGFLRFSLDSRNPNSIIEKLHYKFYYSPICQSNVAEDYILLDILIEPSNYSRTLATTINSPFIKYEQPPSEVYVPSKEDLFADKMTAFAPHTTGIPYTRSGVSMSMEIIKQLYDLGNLFEELEDVGTIEETFHRIARSEMNYRGITGETYQVLEDIYQTALCISTKGMIGNADIKALSEGIRSVNAFVFSERYHIERAIVHASRVAYIAKVISKKAKSIERFENSMQIADWEIKEPLHTKLNKLKKTSPEAFFYWYQIFLLEKPSN